MNPYFDYLSFCQRVNFANEVDPTTHRMEWHHTLPQCVYGDTDIGCYLTLKQHAIATALQTLNYEVNCLCPWHKQHIPQELWELCLPFYRVTSAAAAYRTHECRQTEYLKTVGHNVGVYAQTVYREENPEEYISMRQRGAETQHAQRWQCTVTGYITTPGPLSRYQKTRGIDVSNRKRVA
jgi:hypothetical protein